MKEKLTAIGEFLTTMGYGFIELGKITITAMKMIATLTTLGIVFALPAWAILTTILDQISNQAPGNTVWEPITPNTTLYYLQKIGQCIAFLWIATGIHQLGKHKDHG